MEKYTKSFVKKLYELYGYRICELEGELGSISHWCSVKVNENYAEALVFSRLKGSHTDKNSIEEKIKADTGCSYVNAAFIYIMEQGQEEEFEKFKLGSYPGIVVEKKSSSIIYCSALGESTLNEVYQCLLHMQNENKKTSYPVTSILIGVNIGAYILTAFLSGNLLSSDINVLISLGAKVNSLISAGEYYRFITCMFLHGGIVHLGFNMYALYSLGQLTENIYGVKKYTFIYFVSGILSSIMSFVFSTGVSIGASGAIFGLLGASLVFGFKNKGRIGKDFMMNIIFVIVINLFMGFSIPNVDNFAHLGGLIGGILCAMLFYMKK